MSEKENEEFDGTVSSTEQPREAVQQDPLADNSQFISKALPPELTALLS